MTRHIGGSIDVKAVKEAMGAICKTCNLPQKDHFRGANGVRFVGCEGARVAKMLQDAAERAGRDPIIP